MNIIILMKKQIHVTIIVVKILLLKEYIIFIMYVKDMKINQITMKLLVTILLEFVFILIMNAIMIIVLKVLN